jgi:hypothetical protein
MNLLTERDWNVGYRNEDGGLIELFYNPALACAVQYNRLTGYFSADSLALAARGIETLIANDGRMRLIVGLTLSPPSRPPSPKATTSATRSRPACVRWT